MLRNTISLSIMVFFTLTLAGPVTSQQTEGPPIRLRALTFVPGRESPSLPSELSIESYGTGVRGTFIVQFRGPVEEAWKEAVAAAGAQIIEYIPEFAFKVRMTDAQASAVRALDSVRWVGIFQPAFKVSPRLLRNGARLYTVRIEKNGNDAAAADAMARLGAQVLKHEGDLLVVSASSAAVNAIAQLVDVAWIENYVLRKKFNEYGGGVIMGANVAQSRTYTGSTQTVGVADTGLGGGTVSTAHPDIPSSRIVAINNWPGAAGGCFKTVTNDGAVDVDSGHGTHVSGSILSDGDLIGVGKGTAPAGRLLFQATENYATITALCQALYGLTNGYYLVGIPSDIRQLFQQAYDGGARIHSNSWGGDVSGDYTTDSANADDFVWNHKDMSILFAAGNAGTDANSDGAIDSDSMGSPATAKNVVTVGASENDRASYPCDTSLTYTTCASQQGNNSIFTYGSAWPTDYPAEPVKSDPSAGNAEQMAAFSSRGPTDDGRIKPDVVAPGTWVLSAYSNQYQQGYGGTTNPKNGAYQYDGWGFPYSRDYKYMGGTSMATPLAAGGAAVVRDFYQKAYVVAASAALVKATLINSAEDILDENNDGANDNDFPIPNNHEGWGRIDLDNATDGIHKYVDQSAGLSTNATANFTYNVLSGSPVLKVTLVWSDFPSTAAASTNLVNDLDLEVKSPSQTVFKGNVFQGGWSAAGGSADRRNNVENVYVQSPESGNWTVTVKGFNVPNGPQPFAIVVDATFGVVVDNPPTVDVTSPADGATVSGTISVSATASDDFQVTGVEFFVDTTSLGVDTGAPYSVSWNTTSVGNGNHTLKAVATDSSNQTATDTITVNVQNTGPTTVHIGDLDRSATPGSRWTATVVITVHNAAHAPVANATVSGSWSAGNSGSSSCTTNAGGQCTVTRSVSNGTSSVRYTVSNVTGANLTYSSSANHDPDGDSNGTRITVNKP